MVAIPAVILVTAWRTGNSPKLPTILALLFWLCASVALAGVWFIVTVAAHKTDEALTAAWIIANAAYPAVGLALTLVHRRLLGRTGPSKRVAA
jgi:predicted permease